METQLPQLRSGYSEILRQTGKIRALLAVMDGLETLIEQIEEYEFESAYDTAKETAAQLEKL